MSKAKRVRRSKSKSLPKKVRLSEDALTRQRNMLQGIMENAGVMLAYLDREFNFVAVNSAYAKGSGHTVEELVGKNHFALFPNEENQALFEKVRDTGEPVTFFDKPFEFADQPERGATYWDWTLAPVKGKAGRVQGLILSLFETTQRKRAEEEVRSLSRFPSENPNPVMRISKEGAVQYCNYAGSKILKEWKCQVGQPAPNSWCQLVADVYKSGTKKEFEEEYGTQTFSFILTPIADAGYVNVYGRDITERKKAEEALRKTHDELEMRVQERTKELREVSEKLQAENSARTKAQVEAQIRANQQSVIAQLGQLALGLNLNELFNEAVKQVAQTLDVEYCKVLELLPGEKELLLRAGVGWKEGLVGRATVGTGMDSQAGYTLLSDEPVIVEDLRTEKRFSGPPLLHEHEVVSGMSVIISGHDKPFGVLGAHTTKRRTFTKDDINFLQAAANVLATTIERKKAEEAVKAERKRFIDVLEMLPAYLVLLTPDYHVSYANRFFRERFGEDRGRRCFEYLFGRTEPCEICETYKTLKKMAPLEWEWTGPDGHNYYIFDSPFTDVDGSTLIMEVGIDITERKKAEEALRKAHEELEMRVEERTRKLTEASWKLQAEIAEHKRTEEILRQTRDYLENLLNYANAPIICWDAKFKITRFNHSFERLTGYEAEEVIGKDLSVLFPEESKEESLTKIQRTLIGERWEVVEIPIQRKDSEERTVLWNSANIYADDGKTLMATIAQGQDITEIKEMQAKLEEYSKHLEQLVEEKTQKLKDAERLATIGETAGMVGHDIRNPLQSIEGAVYLAKEELKSFPAESQERKELNEILEIIEHQATYIDNMVADLQDFARTPMPQPRELDIEELIMESLSMVEIPENIEVDTAFQENLQKLSVDPVFIKRVLVNLIENAVQAMPNGGKLTLKVSCDEESTCICVEDTGVGIPEEHKPKMFTPLFSTKAKGQGFGLPVCKKLVEAHSGEITFESEIGKGSTFTIKLPLKRKAN